MELPQKKLYTISDSSPRWYSSVMTLKTAGYSRARQTAIFDCHRSWKSTFPLSRGWIRLLIYNSENIRTRARDLRFNYFLAGYCSPDFKSTSRCSTSVDYYIRCIHVYTKFKLEGRPDTVVATILVNVCARVLPTVWRKKQSVAIKLIWLSRWEKLL